LPNWSPEQIECLLREAIACAATAKSSESAEFAHRHLHGLLGTGARISSGSLSKGVEVGVSFLDPHRTKHPPRDVQAAANYMNSSLYEWKRASNGYAEGIALDTDGHVSEGSAERFLVHDGVLYTPPLATAFCRAFYARRRHEARRRPEHPG